MKVNFKKGKKYFIGGFVVVVLVVGAIVVAQNKEIEIKFDENGSLIVPDKRWYESQMKFTKKVVDLQERLEEMEKLDDFGGVTPEETFNAFVEALKAGDTELASRYFVFNKQEQMARELAIGKENGVLDLLIGDLEEEKVGGDITGGFRFTTIGDDGKAEFSFDLRFNKDTKVWKMESL